MRQYDSQAGSAACWQGTGCHATFAQWHGLPLESNAELRMTGTPFNKITNGERDAILTAIAELGDRMERRFEQVDKRFEQVDKRFEQVDKRLEGVDIRLGTVDGRIKEIETEIKVMKYDVIEAKLSVRNLPTYWHMYVALTGLVVTVFSLMRFAMPGH
jgi:chaperonin cofactor prefoldin